MPESVNKACLSDRIAENRARLFVGRDAEMDLLARLLDPRDALQVLWVSGPGGIGKSSLLAAFERAARMRSIPVVRLDCRNLPPSTAGFEDAVRSALRAAEIGPDRNHLLLIDTFERLASLEEWLAGSFLPQRGTDQPVVIAGRPGPGVAWIGDSGWHGLFRWHGLAALSEDEARRYLEARGLDARAAARAARFARGHPLALALYADAVERSDVALELPQAEDRLLLSMTEYLMDRLDLREMPKLLRAIQASAVVRSTTEPLLARMIGSGGSAARLFDALKGLSFMQEGPHGLFPHDLVRQAILADLKHRNPEAYLSLGQCAFDWTMDRIEAGRGDVMQSVMDAFFLLRDLELQQHTEGPEVEAGAYLDAPGQSDLPTVETMIHEREGARCLAEFRRLYAAQPGALRIIREHDQSVLGFMLLLALEDLPGGVRDRDPVCSRAWRLGGEGGSGRVTLIRFWQHRDCYMDASEVQTLVFAALIQDIARGGIALAATVQSDTPAWRETAELFGHRRLPGTARRAPGGPSVVCYQDFRERGHVTWLRSWFRRVHGIPPESDDRPLPPALRTLEQPEFDQAVRSALKHYLQPRLLARNPLIDLPGIDAGPGGDASVHGRVSRLREAIRTAVDALAETPKTEIHQRVLDRTYLKAAPTQQAAAESLHLSFSTYRRRLDEAVRLVQQSLWQRLNSPIDHPDAG